MDMPGTIPVVGLTVTPLSAVATASPLVVERNIEGYRVHINPALDADTDRFSITVAAFTTAGKEEPLSIPPASLILTRQSPTTPASLVISEVAIAAALRGISSDVSGLVFRVAEVDEGPDGFLDKAEELYIFPAPPILSAQFALGSGSVPVPGSNLLLDITPKESILVNQKLLLLAEVVRSDAREDSPPLRSQTLADLPPVILTPDRSDYTVDGALLQRALDSVALQAGETIRLRIILDANADGLRSSGEAESIIAYPQKPLARLTITTPTMVVYEGTTLEFLVEPEDPGNVIAAVAVGYTITGSGITAGDVSSGSLSGQVVLDQSGRAKISIGLADDGVNEGRESLTVTLNERGVSASANVLDKDGFVILSKNNDLYRGTEAGDFVFGDSGNDTLFGGNGSDLLEGGAGDDSLDGSAGDDTLKGDDGNDLLRGGEGADDLEGLGGSDILFGDAGDDFLNGGAGNDTLNGGEGPDNLVGGDGDDLLDMGAGEGIAYGGPGDDLMFSRGTGQEFLGGLGNDRIEVVDMGAFLDGQEGIDTVVYRRSIANFETPSSFRRSEVADAQGGAVDRFDSVERLVFIDPKDARENRGIALDMQDGAGAVARILATVFGAEAVGNEVYAGIGLDLLDRGGFNSESLMGLAIEAALGSGFRSPDKVVDLLYANVMGMLPAPGEAAPFVAMLREGDRSEDYVDVVARFGVLAAEFNATATDNIDLVGLADTGLLYVPVPSYGS